MTLRKDRDGFYEFECDECGEVLSTNGDSFSDAQEVRKQADWVVEKTEGLFQPDSIRWAHYCRECSNA